MRNDTNGISRREILGAAGAAVSLTVLGTLSGCDTLSLDKKEEKPVLITTGILNIGPAADYHAGKPTVKYYDSYGFVVAKESGTIVAVRPRCTHKGCLAEWKPLESKYICPCHESEFSMLGVAIKGPAIRPMPMVVCELQADGTLTVDLDKLYAAEAALHVIPVKQS